jgi:hypothetical protein
MSQPYTQYQDGNISPRVTTSSTDLPQSNNVEHGLSIRRVPSTRSFSNEGSSFTEIVDAAFNNRDSDGNWNIKNPELDLEGQTLDPTKSLIDGKSCNAENDLGNSPRPLRPYSSSNLGNLALEYLLCLTPLVFIVMAILAGRLNGREVSKYGQNIKDMTSLTPTIFPLVFAAVVGQSLYNIARYKLEHGCKLKVCAAFPPSNQSILKPLSM